MIEIKPAEKIKAEVSVPGSKSITQRALIAAALADGESTLIGPLESEDTRYTAGALQQMGVTVDKEEHRWTVWYTWYAASRIPLSPTPTAAWTLYEIFRR